MEVKHVVNSLRKLSAAKGGVSFSFIPITEMLGVESIDNTIRFKVTNTIVSADDTFEQAGDPYDIAVNFDEFSALMRKLKEGTIELQLDNNQLVVKTNRSRYMLDIYYDTDGSVVTVQCDGGVKGSPLQINKEDAKTIKTFLGVGGSEQFYQLNYANIVEGKLYVSDNHMVASTKLNNDSTFIFPKTLLKVLEEGSLVQSKQMTQFTTTNGVVVVDKSRIDDVFSSEQSNKLLDLEADAVWSTEAEDFIVDLRTILFSPTEEVSMSAADGHVKLANKKSETKARLTSSETVTYKCKLQTSFVEKLLIILEEVVGKNPKSHIFFSSHGDLLIFRYEYTKIGVKVEQ